MNQISFTVRRLLPADAAAYRALMLEAYQLHPSAFTTEPAERTLLPMQWWAARLSDAPSAEQVVFGAFAAGKLVGTVGIEFNCRAKTRHKAHLFAMYVAAAQRRSGLGQVLLQTALAEAGQRDHVELVQLTVSDGNPAAQQLYERCGFQVFGVEPFALKLATGYVSKVHMWRELSAAFLPQGSA